MSLLILVNRIMNENDYFKLYKVEIEKLMEYGFIKEKDTYTFSTSLMNDDLKMYVVITKKQEITTKLIDIFSNEEYILHKIRKANGNYISKVKEQYQQVLEDIKNNCFVKEIFKNEKTKEVIRYVYETFGDELEFLWGEDSCSAVFRRKDVNKWYGLIMSIPKTKLGYDNNEIIEAMNLKGDANKIIDHNYYFPAYHMNKKSWYTINLHSEVPLVDIKELINKSYESLKKC